MDSRSLDFAEEVLQITGGEGVDVVLNSLAGEAIPRGLSILRLCGRFLELGKRDIQQNSQLGLQLLKNNVSFFAIDVLPVWDRLYREKTPIFSSIFRSSMQYFRDEKLAPLPLQVFPISEVVSAFRHMAQAKHIGKIVVSLQEQEVLVAPSSEVSATFRADGTYLITGGLGGLGLSVAQWMVLQGARHLVLIGRSSPSAQAEKALESMQRDGAQVVVAKADVAQEQQVAGVLADIHQSVPPLRGIIHAAGILDDSILLQLNRERFMSVMAPKIRGAWNLHILTLNESLDFFVLFSSAASLLGSPGQGNYAAANAFLDALAHHRRAQGRPAISINWGPWSEVGLAARPNRGGRLALRGMESMTPEQGVKVFGELLRQGTTQVGVMPVNWQQWCQFYPSVGASPLLAHLLRIEGENPLEAGGPSGRESLTRDALLATEPGERQQLVESYLGKQIAKVLGLSASKLSTLDAHQPLSRLGIDSLMAVELKNRIETDLEVTIPMLSLLRGPSVAQLTTLLLEATTGTDSPSSMPLAEPSEPADPQAATLLVSLLSLTEEEEEA
jgi:NADPH:quinone reductase-like Zn-dependent oxidoreductase/acyl carrier protein